MIEVSNPQLSVRRQCELLGINRSGYYYQPKGESGLNLTMMNLIDEQYTRTPFYGSPKMTVWLRRQGYDVNHKRIERLMRKMGLQAIYPKPFTSRKHPGHKIYPYLLSEIKVIYPDQVWGADITYIRMRGGFLYLVAIMDWYSRFVLAWQLSNTLDSCFCVEALESALSKSKPEIFNTDRGAQFTGSSFISVLEDREIDISMDGRGRAMDNIFVERLWRTVKYEEVYLNDYRTPLEAYRNLSRYFEFYNRERFHQSLDYRTPLEVYSFNSKDCRQSFELNKTTTNFHLNSTKNWS